MDNIDHNVIELALADIHRLETAYRENKTSVKARRELLRATKRLANSLQNPGELVDEIGYTPLQFHLAKLGIDLKLFQQLSSSQGPLSTQHLSEPLRADPNLVRRILRGIATFDGVENVGEDLWTKTRSTYAFSGAKADALFESFLHILQPVWQQLPAFFAKTGYQNPQDPLNTPFALVFGEKAHFLDYIQKTPDQLIRFNKHMLHYREGYLEWLDFFPFEKIIEGFDNSKSNVMFVDIGGALGHEIKSLRNRYPNIPGRLILQDQQSTIDQVEPTSDMEAHTYDFFTPQPFKSARVYYLRGVLHDWHDTDCRKILRQIADAMEPGYSKLILNELILHDGKDPGFLPALSDIMILSILAAVERSEKQWADILRLEGLRIEGIWQPNPESGGILVVVKD